MNTVEEGGRDWLDLDELRDLAAKAADPAAWAVIEDGADDEITLRDNVAAWSRIRLRPRMLRGGGEVDTATTLLGTPVAAPIVVGPSGRHGVFNPDGEVATARGAASAATVMAVATASSRSLEEVAAAAPGGLRWFQLYITRDRGWTEELLARAEAAGFRAVVLTVDVPIVGRRRGTDVVKALAMGAGAVLVVRPVLHGLLLDGAEGVHAVLEHLQDDLRRAMVLCGVRRLEDIAPDLLRRPGDRPW
jgi:4-hydroxymandelate oxidase